MVIEELFTKLGFQVDPSGLDRGKKALKSFKKWALGIGAGTAAGFALLSRTAIKASMDMENLKAQFTVMTGSADRAQNLMKQIADFAAATPFDKIGLSDAGKTLMSFGVSAEDVVPTLRMLGDVAGPSSERLSSLALVFGQIRSAGKLTGGDLLQLINVGFNPLQIMAEKTGKKMSDLRDEMAAGSISFADVQKAFEAATSKGGLFYGNLAAQSNTLAGRISTLKDNFVTALQNMADAFMPLLKRATEIAIAFDWTPVIAAVTAIAHWIENDALPQLHTLIGVLADLRDIAKTIYPILMLIFGRRIIHLIAQTTMGMRAAAAANLFMQRAALASGAAAGYQVTALGTLKAALFSVSTTARTAGAAMKASLLALASPINVILAGITGIWTLYNKIKDDTAEFGKELNAKYYKEMVTKNGISNIHIAEQGLYWSKKKLDDLRKSGKGSAEEIEKASQKVSAAQKEVNGLKKAYKEVWHEDYQTNAQVSAKDATTEIQRQLTSSSKALTVKNDNTFNFDIKTKDKKTGTGLTAHQVAELANETVQAQFNLKLKQLVVGGLA